MTKTVAILATDGFEQSELESPKNTLEKEGFKVHIISDKSGEIKGWQHTKWGDAFAVSKTLDEADASQYDALVLPGGVMNPDTLRTNSKAVNFAEHFMQKGKTVAAICHGPQTLLETHSGVKGRKLTSYKAIKTDLTNGGATWVDQEVVHDKNLITSRTPDDLDAFNATLIEQLK